MAYTTIQRVDGFAQPTDGLNGNLTITGRALQHYTVVGSGVLSGGLWTGANVGVNPYVVYSTYSNLVQAIEYVGSIELLGDPTTNNAQFRVAITGRTLADLPATTGAYSLQGYANTTVNGSGVVGTIVSAFTY